MACAKCRQRDAQAMLRQTEPACAPCLRSQLEAQVSRSVRSAQAEWLVRPGDKVLAALSGGPCSRAMLHMLSLLRATRKDRPERGRVSRTADSATPGPPLCPRMPSPSL